RAPSPPRTSPASTTSRAPGTSPPPPAHPSAPAAPNCPRPPSSPPRPPPTHPPPARPPPPPPPPPPQSAQAGPRESRSRTSSPQRINPSVPLRVLSGPPCFTLFSASSAPPREPLRLLSTPMPSITINGTRCDFSPGQMIIQVANA